MGRTPGETTEQWSFRANSDYLDAWTALRVASSVLRGAGWRFPDSSYPLLDESYDQAMDALDAADQERIEALNALDRERHPIWSG